MKKLFVCIKNIEAYDINFPGVRPGAVFCFDVISKDIDYGESTPDPKYWSFLMNVKKTKTLDKSSKKE